MRALDQQLVDALVELAHELPDDAVVKVAGALQRMDGPDAPSRAALTATIPHPRFQARIRTLLDTWRSTAPTLPGAALGLALQTAARSDREGRERLSVTPVWTGPGTASFEPRRTAQVLIDLAQQTERDLWVVTFATYKADRVFDALAEAADRGVRVRLVLESEKESGGKLDFDRIEALRRRFGEKVTIYVWPSNRRPDGKGTLHMKCALSDGRRALVTSANLTDHALHENMELGVLVEGRIAAAVERHLEMLVERGELVATGAPETRA